MAKLKTILMALSLTVCAWGFSHEAVIVRNTVNLETAFIADGELYAEVESGVFAAVEDLRHNEQGQVEAGWITWKCDSCGYDKNYKVWNWKKCNKCGAVRKAKEAPAKDAPKNDKNDKK